MDRVWYRPRAFGDRQADGTWDGWLVFFPVSGGRAIASDQETTQATLDALAVWASSVTPVYLEGALARALRIDQQPSIIDQLNAAEYEALLDADQLETAAQIDHAAADAARADAERLRRERLATESALAANEEAAANLDVEVTRSRGTGISRRCCRCGTSQPTRGCPSHATEPCERPHFQKEVILATARASSPAPRPAPEPA